MDAIDAGIQQTNSVFMRAFTNRNAGEVAALYTEDGQLLPPSSPIVTGKQAIAAYWDGAMKMGVARVELNTLELDRQGATAIEVGRARLFREDGDVLTTAKYVVVWKQQDGNWKLHRDIWNSDDAAGA